MRDNFMGLSNAYGRPAMQWGNRFANSTLGKPFIKGIKENYGWEFNHKTGLSEGFLGFKSEASQRFLRKAGRLGPAGKVGAYGRLAGRNLLGLGGLALSAYSIYQGYQEGGVSGAISAGAHEALIAGVFRAGVSLIGSPVVTGLATLGAVGYAGYEFGEHSRAVGKRFRNLEMGADVVDRFGTVATMRARSVQAIQNSRLNGRSGIGNEAALIHTPARLR